MLTRDSRILVGQGHQEIHPLVNSAILRNIFGYFDVKTLKYVRETCTFWNEEANSLLHNKSHVTINWYKPTERRNIPTLPTFMKYVESVQPENVLFRNYILRGWCFHSKEIEMTEFWLKCGQHIQNLTLKGYHNFGFYESSYVRNIFYNWTPNMETLRLENVRFMEVENYKRPPVIERSHWKSIEVDEENDANPPENQQLENQNKPNSDMELTPMSKFDILEDIQPNYNFHTFSMDPGQKFHNFPLQWKELFIVFPNLRSLSLRPLNPDEAVDNVKEFLEELIEFHEANPHKLHNLKQIDVFSKVDMNGDCVTTDEHFEQAMRLNYKLEALGILFGKYQNLNYSTVSKYISKLSPWLKTLEVGSFEQTLTVFPPLSKRITLFPNLKSLSLELNALSSNNIEFLRSTPKLEQLLIGDACASSGNETPADADAESKPRLFFNTITLEPLLSLRRLHIGQDILTENCVKKIGEWFPNLKEFGAVLDDQLLWAVYKYLCDFVEVLDIKGKGVTDAGITGIRFKRQEAEASPEMSSKSDQESESVSPQPRVEKCEENEEDNDLGTICGISIAQMKKLRRLTISAVDITGIQFEPLTDDAVYNGFILMTELKYLNLNFGIGGSISENAYRDLCYCLNILTLDTMNFYRGCIVRTTGTWRRQRYRKSEI